jgi:hypothetical protein
MLTMVSAEFVRQDAWIEHVLGVRVSRGDAGAGGRGARAAEAVVTPQGINVTFAKLKLEWNAAKAKAHSQLAALERAVVGEFADPATAASAADIVGITAHFNQGLGDTLDDLYNEADPVAKARLATQAATIIRDYEMYVDNDALVAHVEGNPFTTVELRAVLLPPLRAMTTTLGLLDQVVLAQ